MSAKSREAALAEVAFACAGEGRIEDTQDALGELASAEQRDRTYATLVKALAKAGRLDEAQMAAAQIASPEKKTVAEADILSQWADSNNAESIAVRINEIQTREEKLSLFRKLVEKSTAEKKTDEAEAVITAMVEIVEESPRPPVRSKFGNYDDNVAIAEVKAQYLPVARLLAEKEDMKGASRRIAWAAEPILELPSTSGLGKGMLVIQLVNTQVEVGDLEGARQSLEEIEEGFIRSMPAAGLAAVFAKTGDLTAALEMVALVDKQSKGNGSYLGSVVRELIRSNQIPAAKQVLGEMSQPVAQKRSYCAAGRAMLETHRSEELYQWLPDMPTDVARAAACIGAAEGLKPPQPPGS